MQDKAKLGTRYTCFECGTRFYDLNREVPSCPQCSADQRNAPQRDMKSLLSRGGGRRAAKQEDFEPPSKDEDDEDSEDDEYGLLGDNDDDDNDDSDDSDDEDSDGDGDY